METTKFQLRYIPVNTTAHCFSLSLMCSISLRTNYIKYTRRVFSWTQHLFIKISNMDLCTAHSCDPQHQCSVNLKCFLKHCFCLSDFSAGHKSVAKCEPVWCGVVSEVGWVWFGDRLLWLALCGAFPLCLLSPSSCTVFSRSTVFPRRGENQRWLRGTGKSGKQVFLTKKSRTLCFSSWQNFASIKNMTFRDLKCVHSSRQLHCAHRKTL
jgi:hypothetical protein